jgi:O-antigen ligase
MWSGRRRISVISPPAWAGVGFIALALASSAWSDDPVVTLRRGVTLCILTMLAYAIVRLWTDREILAGSILCTMATLVVGVAAEVSSGGFTPGNPDYRFAGIIHPNGMAVNCAILLLCALVGAFVWPTWRRPLLGAITLAAGGLLLTKSRGALAGALIGILVVAAIHVPRNRIALIVLLLGSVTATATILEHSPGEAMRSAVAMGRSDGGDVETLTGRTDLWTQLLGFAADAPLLGYGYDSFWLPKRILVVAAVQGWVVGSSHSGYIDVLLSLGALGAALWVIVLVGAPLRLYRQFRFDRDPATIAGIAVLLMLYLNMTVEVILLETSLPSLIGLVWIISGISVPSGSAAESRRHTLMPAA